MSRKPSSSSKYKISAPQPLPPTGLESYGADNGPYPSFAPRQPTGPNTSNPSRQPDGYDVSRSYSSDRIPSTSSRTEAPPSAGPTRPARSRMREAPENTSPGRPARAPRPLLTADTRVPSGSSSMRQGGQSPISPISPEKPPAAIFNDPFAMDRSQRSELRDQYKMSERQASAPMNASSSGTDKLRNVVGAFMAAGRQTAQPAPRPGKSEARQRARQDGSWDVSADGGKFGELDSVMKTVRSDWPFITGSDFSASTMALSLLSPQSTSLPPHPSLSSFSKLHDSLSAALQSSVQAHFQSFAASLPAHAQFLTTLSRAQDQVRTSKAALKEAREGFAGKGKSELAGVRARERTVRDMLKILDTIDQLKQIPDQLEALIGDKKFLPAALILVRSIKTISKPEISQIGAISELKAYFMSQESTLTDILVEELQSHLYLKNYYSDSRWKAYVPNQQSLPTIAPEDSAAQSEVSDAVQSPTMSPDPSNAVAGPGPSSRFSRYLSSLATRPGPDQMMDQLGSDLSAMPSQASMNHVRADSQHLKNGTADADEIYNPEADSYRYIEAVLEALFVLGKLSGALETVAQRVSTEIHHLIETTLDEVEERSEQRREEEAFGRPDDIPPAVPLMTDKGARRQSVFTPADTVRIAVSLDAMGPARHAVILKDLFWTLYSKLAAVLEGHRVIYEVARWIPSRRDVKDNLGQKSYSAPTIPVLEVWKPIQQEVRNLLYMYLADDSQGSVLERHQILSVNEVLRDGKTTRDRQRQMFRFADTDARQLASEVKPVDEALQKSLKSSVPGLVHMQSADAGANAQQSILPGYTSGSDDRFSSTSKHRTLIPPNAFNVSTLFQPTLAFIGRATSIVPPGFEEETGTFSSVLEDFVVKVFLPQLDEKVTASFQQAVSGYDAFQLDRAMPFTDRPPLKSSVRVMTLIHSLCVMLQSTPFHKENYSRLIIGVIVQYYQQCSARFKDLVSHTSNMIGDPTLALPAVWAQREDLIEVLTEMRSVMPADRSEVAIIASREIELEQKLLGGKDIIETQLVNSQRKLEALGQLCESMRWFIDALLDLQTIAEEPLSPGEGPETIDLPSTMPMKHDDSETPRLPLTRAMKQRYDAIIQTYEQLAEMVLNTMRLEIRCRVMCNLGSLMQKGDFRPESEALEPDADIVDLATVLLESEEVASRTLVAEDRDFLFRGMSHLVDHMFVASARGLKVVNPAGVAKIQRNMLALQQTMRSINQAAADGVLHLSSVYWDMYSQDPKDILETLRITTKPPFSFDNYDTMLNLICKTDTSDAASSDLNTYLIDLHALAMSIDGWEV